MRVLISRPDPLGNVLLSTPVFRGVKLARPDAHVTVLVPEPLRAVLEGLPTVDELLVFDPARHRGLAGVRALTHTFRERQLDALVALYSEPAVAAAAFRARIPIRIGPLSKLHSFLFYNRGVRQARSRVEKHEAEYNLELLEPLGIRIPPRTVFPEVALRAETRRRALDWLQAHGWNGADRWIAMHPGMRGSALNWPEERYVELARSLREEGHRILVTAGPLEPGLIARIRDALGPDDGVAFYEAAGEQVDFLAALFERVDLVIAPSTGPLHLAVAVGAPVLSVYPNLRVQSPARWGPYAADPTLASVLQPTVDCETDPACMGTITVDAALAEAQKLIRARRALPTR